MNCSKNNKAYYMAINTSILNNYKGYTFIFRNDVHMIIYKI